MGEHSPGRALAAIGVAVALTAPAVAVWLVGSIPHLATGAQVAVAGIAVFGAAFLLAWGADAAEKDVPRAVALSALAVVAVAPEYLVDAFYAWEAGVDPGPSHAASLAIANMTGANRLLIGVGWSLVAIYAVYEGDESVREYDGRLADAVHVGESLSVELVFLLVATLYGFLVPLNPLGGPRGIDVFDLAFLVSLYAAYVAVMARSGEVGEESDVGVPAFLESFPRPWRLLTIAAFFGYAGFLMLTVVEPFAHGLEQLGRTLGLPPFVVVQWLAPVASESPELLVTAYLVRRARETSAFNALLSSKLNQWTLLVGTLVVVYSVARGNYAPLPFDPHQTRAVWLTAAQSFFAISLLVDYEIALREAVVLFGLFVLTLLPYFPFHVDGTLAFTAIYVLLGLAIFARRRDALLALLGDARARVTGGSG